MKQLPLLGRTILDCSSLLPGPFVGKLLVDRGARVIKVEHPVKGDPAKELGHYYDFLNSEKEVVGLDLTQEDDWKRFRELVEGADGLIEGYRVATKRKLKLTAEFLHPINPKLVIASISGFPLESPRANTPTHNLNIEALTGVLSMSGSIPPLPLADLFSSYTAALEICAGMDCALRTGKGSAVNISLSGAVMEAQGKFIHEYQTSGVKPAPEKTLALGRFPCYRIYSTKDRRRLSVAPIELKYWTTFCRIIGLPNLVDQRFSEDANVIDQVQSAVSSKNWSEWEPTFKKAKCCVEPVLDYQQVLELESELR
jgi:alpha-methylacyl-CoA racemase